MTAVTGFSQTQLKFGILSNGAYSMETKMVEPYHFRKVSASR